MLYWLFSFLDYLVSLCIKLDTFSISRGKEITCDNISSWGYKCVQKELLKTRIWIKFRSFLENGRTEWKLKEPIFFPFGKFLVCFQDIRVMVPITLWSGIHIGPTSHPDWHTGSNPASSNAVQLKWEPCQRLYLRPIADSRLKNSRLILNYVINIVLCKLWD